MRSQLKTITQIALKNQCTFALKCAIIRITSERMWGSARQKQEVIEYMKKKKGYRTKKPIYKRWLFWIIIVVVFVAIIGGSGESKKESPYPNGDPFASTTAAENSQNKSNSLMDHINFTVDKVRNDVTGNWRIACIAEEIEIKNFALDYYNAYFESDAEIHAIVNFNDNTTTKISVMGNLDLLDVAVHEHVDEEEHDANLLFSGTLLHEYFVNMDSGEVEEIQ